MRRHGMLVLCVLASIACIHPPREYPGKLGSAIQEYLFYREGEWVHLITNQRVHSDQELPVEFAWVIPLPSVPKEYYEESDSLFETLFRAAEPRMRVATLSANAIQVHETRHVGNYEIKPIEILEAASGNELNDWLEANGYHKVPKEGLRYYLKPKACFLAIKVKGLKGEREKLKPLHIVYRAEEVRVPLKFFAEAGVFDVFVYSLGSEPHLSRDLGGKSYGIRRDGNSPVSQASLRLKGQGKEDSLLTRYFGPGINGRMNRIAMWKEDPLLPIR